MILDQKDAGKSMEEIKALIETVDSFAASDDSDRKTVGGGFAAYGCNNRAVTALTDIFGKLTAHGAELHLKLSGHEAALKEILSDHKRQIQKLSQDFKSAMTKEHLSVFLEALSASDLGCLDAYVLTHSQAVEILNISAEELEALVERGAITRHKELFALDQLLRWLAEVC